MKCLSQLIPTENPSVSSKKYNSNSKSLQTFETLISMSGTHKAFPKSDEVESPHQSLLPFPSIIPEFGVIKVQPLISESIIEQQYIQVQMEHSDFKTFNPLTDNETNAK